MILTAEIAHSREILRIMIQQKDQAATAQQAKQTLLGEDANGLSIIVTAQVQEGIALKMERKYAKMHVIAVIHKPHAQMMEEQQLLTNQEAVNGKVLIMMDPALLI